ncbi:uncharacterized protein [Garra rufa]|uniref:uncharacterized protein n=1 Tax=Garra rufa TaxID=137080 RepID=UPI003CCE989D
MDYGLGQRGNLEAQGPPQAPSSQGPLGFKVAASSLVQHLLCHCYAAINIFIEIFNVLFTFSYIGEPPNEDFRKKQGKNVCHPDTEKTEEHQSEDIQCKRKKLELMRFSLSMEDTEIGGPQEPSHPQPEGEENDIEDDCLFDDDLLHSLANMSLNLFDDQDSDAGNPFCNCDWQLNESVITPEKADITYISTQIWKVIKEQEKFLKALEGSKYVAPKQNELCLENTKSAKITILHGTFLGMVTNNSEKGVPVVLNFTGTDNFLSCTIQGEKKILTVKVYDREKISANDPEKASLIFYMSQKCDGLRYFESVLHRGWYIHTVNDNIVEMSRGNSSSSSCFVLE